jgi:RNA methyltransferase, TrmH family
VSAWEDNKALSITSRANPQVAMARRVAGDAAYARQEGLAWIEGDHLVRAALAHGVVPLLAVLDDAAPAALRDLAMAAQRVIVVPAAIMRSITTLESPTPIAMVVPVSQGTMDDSLPSLVLDRLQDPGNVGSILRSAAAFGFAQIIALKGTASLWSTKVLRAGMGAQFGLRLVEQVTMDALDALQGPMLGTSSHATEVLGTEPLPWPCHLLIGHEGKGLDAALLGRCARVVRIAQPGGQESLNAAVAAAICMHETLRARR